MPADPPIRVHLSFAAPRLQERVAAALRGPDFQLTNAARGATPELAIQVLVTDLPPHERPPDTPGQGRAVVLGIGNRQQVDAELSPDFTDRELSLAVRLAARIAELQTEREELAAAHSAERALAETDPLTRLLNRRAWERRVPALLAHAQRNGIPVWLALVDLDKFKQINDREGMNRGDQVLAACAEALITALRREDLVARLGGDEFGILLQNVHEEQVLEISHRMLTSLIAAEGVTASVGVARVDGMNEAESLRIAEKAMRAAKLAGGNRAITEKKTG